MEPRFPRATITLSGKGRDRQWRPPSFRGRKCVASAPATLVNTKSAYDGAVETSDGNGNSKVLEAIDWSNRSLRFGQGNTGSPGTSAVGEAK